ncbi:MAG: conjugative transfer signal peptidase TraF [Myxococcota bacterium]|nr:conjugative transfer signal peptidase TraF [Myxococcota bacterium]
MSAAPRAARIAGAVAAAVWLGPAAPVRINWTGSAPLGLYLVDRPASFTRGDLVAVCLGGFLATIGHARGYLPTGRCPSHTTPVLKEVLAVAADEIELQRSFVAVNGRVVDRSARPAMDRAGRPLQRIPFGHHVVAAGHVWLLGIRPARSWDSRYYGPVPTSDVIARARPLFTWSGAEPR